MVLNADVAASDNDTDKRKYRNAYHSSLLQIRENVLDKVVNPNAINEVVVDPCDDGGGMSRNAGRG
jgi:hypothetical protein